MLRGFTWFTLTILLVGLLCWQPQSSLGFGSMQPLQSGGGTGYLTNGPYDWVNSQFYYIVTGAPPNVCGTLHTFRNGSQLDSPGWICTNGSGNATMGPYSGSSNQTDENIYIEWPDGRQTNSTRHVSDASPPTISISTCNGTAFSGGASDVQWGTGFDFGPAAWSGISATFQDLTTGNYYDSTLGYNSTSPTTWGGSASPYFGMSISWSVTPPPSLAHTSSHSYRWCVWTRDFFYQSNIACVGFTGVP